VSILAVAATLASCSLSSPTFDGPVHDTTRDYLHAVADGTPRAAFQGACGVGHDDDADRVATAEGAGFTFSLVSSTRTDDSATVNVTITGRDGAPSPYYVDLRRENGTWTICGVDTGHISIDVDI